MIGSFCFCIDIQIASFLVFFILFFLARVVYMVKTWDFDLD